MTEAELYERLGRMLEQCERNERGFNSLLDTLGKVVSGEIDRSRVMVNLTDKAVTWAAAGERSAGVHRGAGGRLGHGGHAAAGDRETDSRTGRVQKGAAAQ